MTKLLRAILSIALLATVALILDLSAVLATLAQAAPGPILAALVLVQVQVVLSAWRWQEAERAMGGDLPFGRAVREYYAASFLNMVLPGGVGGDAARVMRVRDGRTWWRAVAPVLVERGAGQIAMLIIVLFGLVAAPLSLDAPVHVAVGGGIGSVALIVVLYRVMPRLAAFRGPAGRRQIALSLIIAGSYVAAFALCAWALGAAPDGGAAVVLIPLTLLAMALPLSVGGWGLRESAAAVLWPLAGLPAEQGVAASVLYGITATLGAAPGLIWAVPSRRG